MLDSSLATKYRMYTNLVVQRHISWYCFICRMTLMRIFVPQSYALSPRRAQYLPGMRWCLAPGEGKVDRDAIRAVGRALRDEASSALVSVWCGHAIERIEGNAAIGQSRAW
jgi:hypothetical protein